MKPIYSAPIACLTLWLGVATAAQTQNVGIGTAVPQARLHVAGGVRADGALAATPIALLPTEVAHAGGSFASVGDAQYRRVVLRRLTTTATPEALTLDGNAPTPTNQVAVPVGAVYLFTIRLAASSLAPANHAAGYVLTGVIRNAGGTTSFVGTPLVLAEFEDDALWEATAEANDTHDALTLRVQGAAGHSIRWVGTVELVHVQ